LSGKLGRNEVVENRLYQTEWILKPIRQRLEFKLQGFRRNIGDIFEGCRILISNRKQINFGVLVLHKKECKLSKNSGEWRVSQAD
jgi:hypothetical protein